MQAKINANPLYVLALCSEASLYNKLVPFCDKAFTMKQIDLFTIIATTIMYFPFISDRETIFVGEGIDRLDVNGTIILQSRTIDTDPDFLNHF